VHGTEFSIHKYNTGIIFGMKTYRDVGNGGAHIGNICYECNIDYPLYTKFCIRCGKRLPH
jgi:hypothetical protein